MEMTHQLIPFLKRLRLSGILETLEVRNQQAIDGKWTYVEFLARLLEDEVERRAQKQLALRIRRAAINTTKTLEGFDFTFNPTLNRQQILDLATCTYIRQKRNVLICGPTGVGKTHLAQALTHEACRRGYTALFINTYRMLQHLNGGRADGTLERRFQTYLRPDLLVLDDFGLKPLRPPAPEDFYDVINERYEQGSILLTSNRPPEEWPDLFRDPLLASAGLDRLTHGASVVVITGASFRAHRPRSTEKEVHIESSDTL
jgi:DNA replication protein DnaC